MIVLRDLFKVKLDKPSIATIGTFDGFIWVIKKLLNH